MSQASAYFVTSFDWKRVAAGAAGHSFRCILQRVLKGVGASDWKRVAITRWKAGRARLGSPLHLFRCILQRVLNGVEAIAELLSACKLPPRSFCIGL